MDVKIIRPIPGEELINLSSYQRKIESIINKQSLSKDEATLESLVEKLNNTFDNWKMTPENMKEEKKVTPVVLPNKISPSEKLNIHTEDKKQKIDNMENTIATLKKKLSSFQHSLNITTLSYEEEKKKNKTLQMKNEKVTNEQQKRPKKSYVI